MAYPNPADLPAMAQDPAVTLMEQEGLNVGYLAFNTEKKPFDDARVRKALNMAINKPAIIEAVFQGAGEAAKNPMPPTMWSYNDAIQDDPYDPEAAKKLLAEAGVADLKTNLWAMPVQRPYNPNAKRMAELIQADWKAVGVEAEIVSYEWGEYLKRSKAGEHETVLLGWTADNGDPDNFLGVLLSCEAVGDTNRARWCNQEFDDLINKAQPPATRPSGPSSTSRRRRSSSTRPRGRRSRTPWSTSRSARKWSTSRSTRSARTSSTASTSRAETENAAPPAGQVSGGRSHGGP